MNNKETFKVERGVPLPKGGPTFDPFQEALIDMNEGDCITVAKCRQDIRKSKKNPDGYPVPSRGYTNKANQLWRPENCKAFYKKFYDDDGDMGLKIWKVKR